MHQIHRNNDVPEFDGWRRDSSFPVATERQICYW